MLILGIETSCDETAAAVVADGRVVLSSVVATQFELHAQYGGVVPEIAARRHLENILPVIQGALDQAGITLADLDGLAVTQRPGLIGALIIGMAAAKALSYTLGKAPGGRPPFAGPHHGGVSDGKPAGRSPSWPWWSPAATPTSTGWTALRR